ncbi:MAG: aldo/keto reductase [Anaerolineae bacterium]
MQYRILGRTGQRVSEVGMGTWNLAEDWGPTDDAEALRALRKAFDCGITFFDTALGYGEGHSEELIGQALRDVRDQVVIATKIPPKSENWPVAPHVPASETFSADWVIACTERSLRNLGVDYIDVQQLHAWNQPYTEQLSWHEGLMRMKEQGKIRSFGVSANDWDPYGVVDLVRSGLVDTIQVIYNIFEQRPVDTLLPAALEHNVGIIVRVPFEEGLLTGKIGPGHRFAEGDWRADWLTTERLREASDRVMALRTFLRDDRPDLATLALKFVLSHRAVSTVIPGMRNSRHVESNCAASDGILLSPEDYEALQAHRFVHGWVYPWAS